MVITSLCLPSLWLVCTCGARLQQLNYLIALPVESAETLGSRSQFASLAYFWKGKEEEKKKRAKNYYYELAATRKGEEKLDGGARGGRLGK